MDSCSTGTGAATDTSAWAAAKFAQPVTNVTWQVPADSRPATALPSPAGTRRTWAAAGGADTAPRGGDVARAAEGRVRDARRGVPAGPRRVGAGVRGPGRGLGPVADGRCRGPEQPLAVGLGRSWTGPGRHLLRTVDRSIRARHGRRRIRSGRTSRGGAPSRVGPYAGFPAYEAAEGPERQTVVSFGRCSDPPAFPRACWSGRRVGMDGPGCGQPDGAGFRLGVRVSDQVPADEEMSRWQPGVGREGAVARLVMMICVVLSGGFGRFSSVIWVLFPLVGVGVRATDMGADLLPRPAVSPAVGAFGNLRAAGSGVAFLCLGFTFGAIWSGCP